MNDAPHAVDRHAATYGHLLTNLRHLYGRARLAVVSLLPTRGEAGHLNRPIRAFNEALRDLASSHGAVFWDLHAHLLDAATGEARAALFRDDGTHLNRRGYRVLSAFIEEHAHHLRTPHHPPRTFARLLRRRFVPPGLRRAVELVAPSLPLPITVAAGQRVSLDRQALARRLVETWGRDAWAHKAATDSEQQFLDAHVLPEIDFLCRHVATGAPVFAALYLGSRASFFAHNRGAWAEAPEGLRSALDRDRDAWLAVAPPALRPTLERAFAELRARLPVSAPKPLRLLFIGDCLLEDVELLLAGQVLSHGLLAEVEYVCTRNPSELARAIDERSRERFDGVVYSPLSWDFDPEFAGFLEPRLASPAKVKAEVESIWQRVSSTIARLGDAFECPIYVHNTAATVRASTEVRRALKGLLTWPQRDFARRQFAERVGALVDELNRRTFHHLVVIDEHSAVGGLRDDLTLGRFVYNSDAIHPASLSVEVATQLTDYVVAAALLASKKVVVCDLDNTLWDGVIGEGLGVRHHLGRQRILAALKRKGVVLAIASKNDPANVRWDGGVLQAGDFVAQEISWAPKPVGLRRLQQALNLKLKDFVFIDDRADERELASQEFPELLALNPCAEHTWHLFEAWADLLGDDEGDRTQQYRERSEREKVIGEAVDPAASRQLFGKLGLAIELRRATDADLKRVHELINRTNQWNLVGSRCTFNEVRAWHESAQHALYVARVRDKFGDMGLVCVGVVEFGPTEATISTFVLSCRVFGYGVETLLLDRVARDAAARYGQPRVRGRYVPNAHNKPCATMYAAHGFVPRDEWWVFAGGPVSAPWPDWFSAA